MASVLKIKSGETCQWGVPSSVAYAQGVVKSVTKGKGSKIKEMPGTDGETIAIVFYDQHTEFTINVYAKTTVTEPESGDALTVAGVACLVLSSKLTWSSEDYCMFEVTCKKWAQTLA